MLHSVHTVGEGLYRAVIFDLGGVLVEVPGASALRELAGFASEEEVWGRWLGCVDAARACGYRAQRVQGVAEARSALMEEGVLLPRHACSNHDADSRPRVRGSALRATRAAST